jgi:hypothetical protein
LRRGSVRGGRDWPFEVTTTWSIATARTLSVALLDAKTCGDSLADRTACAWLIRRFIDPDAEFAFIGDLAGVPADTTPFDMRGAEFSHQQGTLEDERFHGRRRAVLSCSSVASRWSAMTTLAIRP